MPRSLPRSGRGAGTGTGRIRSAPAGDREAGSAVIEFIFLVVLLMVPLVYLVIGAAQLQSATYAAVGAADHGAKVFVTADSEAQAGDRVADAVNRAAANMGIDRGPGELQLQLQRGVPFAGQHRHGARLDRHGAAVAAAGLELADR